MPFVRLTHYANGPVDINISRIIRFAKNPDDNRTRLTIEGEEDTYTVTEDVDTVRRKISDAENS